MRLPQFLVPCFKHVALGQARGQAQRHRGIVGPFAGLEVKGAAADHVGDGREGASALELDSGAHGVAAGESEQAAAKAIEGVHFSFPSAPVEVTLGLLRDHVRMPRNLPGG